MLGWRGVETWSIRLESIAYGMEESSGQTYTIFTCSHVRCIFQAALRTLLSVCLSHLFHCSSLCIFMKFSRSYYYPSHNEAVGWGGGGGWGWGWVGILVSLRPSCMLYPLCNVYSSGWIHSMLGKNDQYHDRVGCAQWPLTLTYIFKVIQAWLKLLKYVRSTCRVRSVTSTVLDEFLPY